MAELTVEQRLEKLERYAQTECWRCLGTIPLNNARNIPYPGGLSPDGGGDILLCDNCKSDYDELEDKEHSRYEYALKDWLKEIRRKQTK